MTSHFLNESPKSTMLLCIGVTISLQGCNFQPLWGLHNGACGTMQEIIYDKEPNPNFGYQPNTPSSSFLSTKYIGPPWDVQNLKVCLQCTAFLDYRTIQKPHIDKCQGRPNSGYLYFLPFQMFPTYIHAFGAVLWQNNSQSPGTTNGTR